MQTRQINLVINKLTKAQYEGTTKNADELYITTDDVGLTSSDITTALGYTPYNASNPNGYTSNVGTVTKVNNVSPVNGNVTLTIPTVNNATLTITQGGVSKGTFTANASSDTTIALDAGGSSRNIGEIVTSTIPLTDAGLHLLDGSLIQGDGIYADFVDYITGLDLTANYFCTETEWQQSITDYGVCGKFVYTQPTYQLIDTASGTTGWFVHSLEVGSQVYATNGTPQITIASVSGNHITVTGTQAALFPNGFDRDTANDVEASVRLPKITGIVEGTTDLTALGDLVEAGLPNITGGGWNIGGASNSDWSGAFSSNVSGRYNLSSGTQNGAGMLYFNASRSNSIYGNSSTVQPQAIKVLYYIVVATSTKTQIQVDIDEIATDLNGKADVDLTNCTDVANIKMAHNAMPSNTYKNLTLGASGATYTAPADGYFSLGKQSSAVGQGASIFVRKPDLSDSLYGVEYHSATGGQNMKYVWAVKKGSVTGISYNLGGTTNWFRFIYANGSESEAQ